MAQHILLKKEGIEGKWRDRIIDGIKHNSINMNIKKDDNPKARMDDAKEDFEVYHIEDIKTPKYIKDYLEEDGKFNIYYFEVFHFKKGYKGTSRYMNEVNKLPKGEEWAVYWVI